MSKAVFVNQITTTPFLRGSALLHLKTDNLRSAFGSLRDFLSPEKQMKTSGSRSGEADQAEHGTARWMRVVGEAADDKKTPSPYAPTHVWS